MNPHYRVVRPWRVARVQLKMYFADIWRAIVLDWEHVKRTETITNYRRLKWIPVTLSIEYLTVGYESQPPLYISPRAGALTEARALQNEFFQALNELRASGATSQ